MLPSVVVLLASVLVHYLFHALLRFYPAGRLDEHRFVFIFVLLLYFPSLHLRDQRRGVHETRFVLLSHLRHCVL